MEKAVGRQIKGADIIMERKELVGKRSSLEVPSNSNETD